MNARWENIPLSTLVRFQNHYCDEAITKWDIFHYVYAVLHHPEYRTRYAANLRRELPRIPLLGGPRSVVSQTSGAGEGGAAAGVKAKKRKTTAPPPLPTPEQGLDGASPSSGDAAIFHTCAAIGKRLADLHVHFLRDIEEFNLTIKE